jgi:nicotinamide-nucleotide amidase
MIDTVAILSTGDELTTGRTVDTNASYIADKMVGVGLDVVAVLVVGDYPGTHHLGVGAALRMADVVISTGGLGPTADDLTTETIGAMTAGSSSIKASPIVSADVRGDGSRHAGEQSEASPLPEGAEIVPNPMGTAPGFRLM